MLKNKKICVVVPAYNVEKLVQTVIKTMPSFVDLIIVVDDQSKDKTSFYAKKVAKESNKKIEVIVHAKNQGVGGAMTTGYKRAMELEMDATAVMAGDAQMDPTELESLVLPIISGDAEYTKGNRLIYGQAWKMIPKVRYMGNSILSLLTKIASGYWHVADSQTGYTVISLGALQKINLNDLYKRYGIPNDILIRLNVINARVKEIPIKPIYNVGEKSGIRLWKVVPTISWLLIKRFCWRLKEKYIIENFHPLVFFYLFSSILSVSSVILLVRMIMILVDNHWTKIPPMNALALVFCLVMATQFSFFAMWFDMDDNKDLRVK